MAIHNSYDDTVSTSLPEVRSIGSDEVMDSISKGLADFNAVPTHALFLAVIYPILMVVFGRAYAGHDFLPLVFPIIAGSTLLGPLAASGMYVISQRLEKGQKTTWLNCFDVLKSPQILSIAALGVVLISIWVAWLFAAMSIYWYFFGAIAPNSMEEFIRQVFTTSSSIPFMVVGCVVGFCFSVLVLTVSLVSFPMLLDRNVGPTVAVLTSIKAVVKNPKTVAVWGLIVAGSLMAGAVPVFIGLAIVMPVLGHTTWHLYRKLVV